MILKAELWFTVETAQRKKTRFCESDVLSLKPKVCCIPIDQFTHFLLDFKLTQLFSVSKHILWISIHQTLFFQHVGVFTKHPKQAQHVCCMSMVINEYALRHSNPNHPCVFSKTSRQILKVLALNSSFIWRGRAMKFVKGSKTTLIDEGVSIPANIMLRLFCILCWKRQDVICEASLHSWINATLWLLTLLMKLQGKPEGH